MSVKLWDKGYALDPAIERFGAARNAAHDAALARYDLWGSLAHARMLCRVGLIAPPAWAALDAALRDLLPLAEAGDLRPAPEEEDIHTTVEQRLVAAIGDPGKQLHTGRSRNDQVLVDLRLYARDALDAVAGALLNTVAALADFARREEWTPLPGYTHMQRAMLSSVGLWASAHAEALLDDLGPLAAAYTLNDQSPLGSGAAFGVPLPLDRPYVADLLGFDRAQGNALAVANGRGKGEAAIVQALALIMLDLSKFAQDVLLYTTSEFGFFVAPQDLCDGSSMMPQKRNLSALELVRARAQTVIALQGQMLATLAGLPSGYNMDYQETKAPLLEAVALTAESLAVVARFAARLAVDADRARAAITPELFATDRAYQLVRAGVPFRDAYRAVAADPAAGSAPADLVAHLRARDHLGGPGNLDLDGLDARAARDAAAWSLRQRHWRAAIAALTGGQLTAPTLASSPSHSSPEE